MRRTGSSRRSIGRLAQCDRRTWCIEQAQKLGGASCSALKAATGERQRWQHLVWVPRATRKQMRQREKHVSGVPSEVEIGALRAARRMDHHRCSCGQLPTRTTFRLTLQSELLQLRRERSTRYRFPNRSDSVVRDNGTFSQARMTFLLLQVPPFPKLRDGLFLTTMTINAPQTTVNSSLLVVLPYSWLKRSYPRQGPNMKDRHQSRILTAVTDCSDELSSHHFGSEAPVD